MWLTLCANFVPVRRAGQGRAQTSRLESSPSSCQTEEEEPCQPRSQRLSTISSNMDILLVPPAMSLDSIICRIKQYRSLDQEYRFYLFNICFCQSIYGLFVARPGKSCKQPTCFEPRVFYLVLCFVVYFFLPTRDIRRK